MRIGIDLEEEYEREFIKRFNNKKIQNIQFYILGSDSSIDGTDFLIIDEQSSIQDSKKFIIRLTTKKTSKENEVYKYQRFSQVYKEIMGLIRNHLKVTEGNNFRIISILSPGSAYKKKVVALGLSTQLSEMGYRVLYINLDSIDINDSLLNSSYNYGFSKLFIEMGEAVPKIEACFTYDQYHRFYFLSAPENYLEKKLINVEKWHQFIGYLAKHDSFDLLIVELSSDFDEVNEYFMKISQSVIHGHGMSNYEKIFDKEFLNGCKSILKDFDFEIILNLDLLEECDIEKQRNVDESEDVIRVLLPSKDELIVKNQVGYTFDPTNSWSSNLKILAETVLERMVAIE